DDNEDFSQELEESTVSDNEACSPTTDNLPSEVTEATKVTEATEATEATK
ncbi:5249_t:CDS:1, partial [Racocetra fulgida]